VNILGGKGYVKILNPTSSERNEYLKNVQNDLAQTDADMIAVSAGFDNHEADWGGLLKTEDYKLWASWCRMPPGATTAAVSVF